MPIPTYDQMLPPILALAEKGEISRRRAAEAMVEHFHLTPEEVATRLPSGGSTYVRNRAGWAMTFLTKARLIEKTAPRIYRITEAGRAFLEQNPTFNERDLKGIPGYKEAWQTKAQDDVSAPPAVAESERSTPEDMLERRQLHAGRCPSATVGGDSRTDSRIFRRPRLDVLLGMGYCDPKDRNAAAQRLGKSGDEGIDGRINQDALGLDQILDQAKRYAPDRPIDRKTIQAFIGSLAGQGVTKGVFITTRYFAETSSTECSATKSASASAAPSKFSNSTKIISTKRSNPRKIRPLGIFFRSSKL